MGSSQKRNPTTRFLIYSFIGLLIFSMVIFSLLGIYMNRKSKKPFTKSEKSICLE